MLAGTDCQVFNSFEEVVSVSADTGQKVTGSSGMVLYLRVHSQKNANHPVKQTCVRQETFLATRHLCQYLFIYLFNFFCPHRVNLMSHYTADLIPLLPPFNLEFLKANLSH